jgi:hypothetical protein
MANAKDKKTKSKHAKKKKTSMGKNLLGPTLKIASSGKSGGKGAK